MPAFNVAPRAPVQPERRHVIHPHAAQVKTRRAGRIVCLDNVYCCANATRARNNRLNRNHQLLLAQALQHHSRDPPCKLGFLGLNQRVKLLPNLVLALAGEGWGEHYCLGNHLAVLPRGVAPQLLAPPLGRAAVLHVMGLLHSAHGLLLLPAGLVGGAAALVTASCNDEVGVLARNGNDRYRGMALAVKVVRVVGDALHLTPNAPRNAEAPPLVEGGGARQAHTGRLADLLAIIRANHASRKEAAARALLARMDESAAARHGYSVNRPHVVAARAVGARLGGTKLGGVKRGLHKPVDLAR